MTEHREPEEASDMVQQIYSRVVTTLRVVATTTFYIKESYKAMCKVTSMERKMIHTMLHSIKSSP
jgi:hypothetical protein